MWIKKSVKYNIHLKIRFNQLKNVLFKIDSKLNNMDTNVALIEGKLEPISAENKAIRSEIQSLNIRVDSVDKKETK